VAQGQQSGSKNRRTNLQRVGNSISGNNDAIIQGGQNHNSAAKVQRFSYNLKDEYNNMNEDKY
jgi:hypothetical protein